jgi:hypothetical protein
MTVDTLSGLYSLDLLYPAPPAIDRPALLAELRSRLGRVETLVGDMLAFVAHDFPVPPQDGIDCAIVFLSPSDEPFDATGVRGALEQTWNWAGAGAALAECRYAITLTDMMARGLDPRRRWQLVRGALESVFAIARPDVVHWAPAQKLVDPAGDLSDPLLPVNARLFRVENRLPGECVMDTVGLHLLGLPDLQVHFVGMEPDRMARYLLDVAGYLLAHGPVLGHGQRVAGIGEGEQWTCTEEAALVGPARPVVAIRPSPRYAVG